MSYVIRRAGRFMLIYLVLIGGLVFMFKTLPTGFLPDEDQGMLFAQIQLPTGATQEETTKVLGGSNATSSKRKRNPSTV